MSSDNSSTNSSASTDLIPSGVHTVISLFEGPLKSVNFPNIDRERLQERIQEVESSAQELNDLLARVDGLQQTIAEAKDRLVKDAERAVAYARVYAAEDEALLETLSSVEFGSSADKKRRPRKAAAGAAAEAGQAPKKRKPKAAAEAEVESEDSDS